MLFYLLIESAISEPSSARCIIVSVDDYNSVSFLNNLKFTHTARGMNLLDRNQDAERTTILATAKSPRISSIDHDTGTKSGSTMSVG